jgi:glycine/D-amino acid oxidase-like deaminating enzyme
VAVVEADRIAWSASGRNTGLVLPGFAQGIDIIAKRVGLDHAKSLWALSEAGLEYVRATVRETGMPGVDLVEGGWLKVATTDATDRDLAMVQLLAQDIGAAAEGWPTDQVRDVLRSNSYFHAIHYPGAFHIHPLNYALGLAAAAEQAGARIYELTPALSIDTEGVRKLVVTPAGTVRAFRIVLAGSVHLGGVMGRVTGTLLPVWTYVATTAPLGDRISEAIRYQGAVSDTDLADNHYRIVGGDRLMWSGGLTTWEANPKSFVRQLKGGIERVFPQLYPVEIEHIWTGILGNALHRMPQVGELLPNVWLASGFGGHGLNTTAMAGSVIARAIDEGDDTWRLFLPFELVWAGGRIGRFAAQMHYWWSRSRERSKARQARNREAELLRGGSPAARLSNMFKPKMVQTEAVQNKTVSGQASPAPTSPHAEQSADQQVLPDPSVVKS